MRRPVTIALLAAAIVSLPASMLIAAPAAARDGESITVQVVRDLDGNGSQGPRDTTPVADIQVTIEDSRGNSFLKSTDADGVARFDLTDGTGYYRVYTSIPENMQYLRPAPAGGTVDGEPVYDPLVAFVDLTEDSKTRTLLQAVWNPHQWVQSDPDWLLTQQRPWNAPGPMVVRGDAERTQPIAGNTTVGSSLHGAAYDRWSETAYYSTLVRRNAPWANDAGTGGNGVIYRQVIPTDPTQGVGTPEVFVTLDAGDSVHEAEPLDSAIFAAVGKEGLGDIQLSPDGLTLYVVNLFDKKLYAMSTADPTDPATYDIPVPTAMAGREDDLRPFGLGFFDGVLYVGGVDSAESVPGTDLERRDALRAYVWTFQDGAFDAEPIVAESLRYLRGAVYSDPNSALPPTDAETHWNAWKSSWTGIDDWGGAKGGGATSFLRYPQPILSDIVVDVDGSLVLGFKDRTGAMGGYQVPAPTGGGTLYETMSGGDLIRVCKTPADWVWECENNNVNGAGGTTQSDLVAEFYPGEYVTSHEEAAFGSVTFLPDGTLAATGIVQSQQYGLLLLTSDGSKAGRAGGATHLFQKAGGLGAVAVVASTAIPIQLGNRTWFDTDGDGIQEPGDRDLAGVTAWLIDANDQVVAETITDENGLYYFWERDGLTPNVEWSVRFDYSTVTNLPPGVTVEDIEWTAAHQEKDLEVQSRADVLPNNHRRAQTPRVTLAPGTVDHTLDAGVRIATVPTVPSIPPNQPPPPPPPTPPTPPFPTLPYTGVDSVPWLIGGVGILLLGLLALSLGRGRRAHETGAHLLGPDEQPAHEQGGDALDPHHGERPYRNGLPPLT